MVLSLNLSLPSWRATSKVRMPREDPYVHFEKGDIIRGINFNSREHKKKIRPKPNAS